MLEDTLKIWGGISDKRIERFKRDVLFVSIQEFRAPEFLIAKKIVLRGAAASEREPLHVISHPDVVDRRIIERWMRSGCRHDRCKMGWKFFRRRPLIEPCIGAAPHRHFAVAEGLLCQPFHDVVSIAGVICKRLKFAARVSSTANIDKRERVAV